MIKARFSEQQQSVKFSKIADKYYIFICLNEEKKTDQSHEEQGEPEEYFEYDYAEIVESATDIDIEDVKSNPSKYLNYLNPDALENIKSLKLKEISDKCEETIYNGVDVKMSDGTYHFSLTEKDQLNIFGLQAKISAGQTALEYHADGQPCKYYSVEDIQKLITAAMTLVSYNTTYCNSLNMWIKAETDSSVIENIFYGIDIPETYQSDVLKQYLSQKDK
nr:MAG TPA: hypothetical protein [Bacteriophage sp.]